MISKKLLLISVGSLLTVSAILGAMGQKAAKNAIRDMMRIERIEIKKSGQPWIPELPQLVNY